MYSKYREHAGLEDTSSLQRVPDYRGLGLERVPDYRGLGLERVHCMIDAS